MSCNLQSAFNSWFFLKFENFLRNIFEGGFYEHVEILKKEIFVHEGAVLDVGCGGGTFSGYFDAADYTGIDFSESSLSLARSRFPRHRFQRMDICRMDFPDNGFKRCFVAGVLHHLNPQETGAALLEIYRVLSPEGVFVVWEDVPARCFGNLPGHLAHTLDRGQYIRKTEDYRRDLLKTFRIEKEYAMRSGFMDYAVFCCRKDTSL